MVEAYNGLFAASFQVPTLVQLFFCIQLIWTGVMGCLITYDPTFSPSDGVYTKVKGAVCTPTWRCLVRQGGSMFLVAAGALFFGTRDSSRRWRRPSGEASTPSRCFVA